MIALTGASGLVGQAVCRAAAAGGVPVVTFGRGADIEFDLAAPRVAPGALNGCAALIHCAYHFDRRGNRSVEHQVNVTGTTNLLVAARAMRIPSIVTSSMSARPPVSSTYAATKRAIEDVARRTGALVVRPGLVWHETASTGLVATLERLVAALPVLPVPWMPYPNQATVHADDLAAILIDMALSIPRASSDAPTEVGHPHLFTLRGICAELAARSGARARLIDVPPAFPRATLTLTDALGLPVGFRKDNLLGLLEASPPQGLTYSVAGTRLRAFQDISREVAPR